MIVRSDEFFKMWFSKDAKTEKHHTCFEARSDTLMWQ